MSKQASKWHTEELAQIFSEGVRGAIPGAKLQLEVIKYITGEWLPLASRILDLGCGDGILGRLMLEKYPAAHVTFCDFSKPMLEKLQKTIGKDHRTTVINLDFAKAAWTEGVDSEKPFDIILSGFAIHHQPDSRKRELYAEIFGLLGAGGIFLNLEQVSSATLSISRLFDGFFLNSMRDFHSKFGANQAMKDIEEAYYQDKKENIPAPVEEQCQWLRDIGFQDVDCFFKVFELAVFGGRKT